MPEQSAYKEKITSHCSFLEGSVCGWSASLFGVCGEAAHPVAKYDKIIHLGAGV